MTDVLQVGEPLGFMWIERRIRMNTVEIVYDSPFRLWVESLNMVIRLLDMVRTAVGIVADFGFEARTCRVGGGVHELDTGYEEFHQVYGSFAELERCLIDDYRAMEASLRGTWLSTLNFEYIEIQLVRNTERDTMRFCRGTMKLSGYFRDPDEIAAIETELKAALVTKEN